MTVENFSPTLLRTSLHTCVCRLGVDVEFLGSTSGQSMEVILDRIATRPPPVFPYDLIRIIPDEIDLTSKILEATFLVAILESPILGFVPMQEGPVLGGVLRALQINLKETKNPDLFLSRGFVL